MISFCIIYLLYFEILLRDFSNYNCIQNETYAAINIAAVPTSCNFDLTTLMYDKKRSIYEMDKYRVSSCNRYSSATSTNQSINIDLIEYVISGCFFM